MDSFTPQATRAYPGRLSTDEAARITGLLQDGFAAGRSVYAAWYDALDAGDPIASQASWYRIARQPPLRALRPSKPPRKRRATAMPQFEANRPNQVWSWDISKLPGKYKGDWLNLYVVIDVFSRYVVSWRVEWVEDDAVARGMFEAAFAAQQAHPEIVHSDGGPSMMSDTLNELYAMLGITRSKNRPRVSNDNPFSEAWFKTAKYQQRYPGWFHDIDHAREWATTTISEYNTQHHHTALEGHTPATVHDGTWTHVHDQRQATLSRLATAHPDRYRRQPLLKTPFSTVRLNLEKTNERLRTG